MRESGSRLVHSVGLNVLRKFFCEGKQYKKLWYYTRAKWETLYFIQKVAVRNTWVGAHALMNNTGLSDEAWLPCAS